MKITVYLPVFLILAGTGSCSDNMWNNPYPEEDNNKNIYYDSFNERPKHLDPVSSYSEDEALINGQVYEPPLQYHFLKRPYQLVPLAATSMPEPVYYDSEGKQLPADADQEQVATAVYRINIRKNTRYQPHPAFARDAQGNYLYHDLLAEDLEDIFSIGDFSETGSRELIAADYVYQIKRLVKPGLHSPVGGLMTKYIKGLGDFAERLREAETAGENLDLRRFEFEGARVIDKYTYEIRLNQKYPQFRYWLAMYFFAPVPWEADRFYSQPGFKEKNLTLDWYPVGTGPYMLSVNNPNRHMILSRNPNFHGETYPDEGEEGDRAAGFLDRAGEPMPFIDKAYYSLEKEAIPEWNKFLQGYYDASGILSDSFDQAIQFSSGGDPELTPVLKEKDISLITAVRTSNNYMAFNMRDDVVGGDAERARLLRRAISIAVDYEELISIFANGRGVAAQGPIPPGIFGHLDGEAGVNPYVYDWVNGKPKRKSLDEAKKVMEQAGYRDGRDQTTGKALVLYYDTVTSGAGSKPILNWYRKQFEKLGIQLVVRATDYNRFQDKIREGTAQIFSWGWNADYPDPENFLFLLYGKNTRVEHQGENASNYQNPEYDELFRQMRSMENGPERQRIINQMVSLLRRDAPWLFGLFPMSYSLYHSWYGNAKPNLMARNRLKYKAIDPVLRAEKRLEWNRPVTRPLWVLLGIFLLSIIPAVITYQRKQRAPVI